MNQVSEYWYIGSILARSEIVKNKILPCFATYNTTNTCIYKTTTQNSL